MIERRGAVRYPIEVPVSFEGGTGMTRDISLSGIRFVTDRAFVPDQPVRLSVLFGKKTGPLAGLPVNCRGRILRVGTPDAERRFEVAAVIENVAFAAD